MNLGIMKAKAAVPNLTICMKDAAAEAIVGTARCGIRF
jgi:hypothetical protein